MTTVLECSGVGDGGITRVLTEIVRHWRPEQLVIVGAPDTWAAPESAASVEVVSRQASSRERTIINARSVLRRVTSGADAASTRVLSLSPSIAVAGSVLPATTIVHDLAFKVWPHDLSAAVKAYRRVSYATAVARSARLLTVSERTRHDLLGHYGIAGDQCAVWSPGSDLTAGDGEIPPALAGGPYLLVTGHAPHKGVELAVEALPWLPGYTLGVLTGGRSFPELVRLAEKHAVADRVVFLDRLSDDDYAAALASARAFLMPSHFEGYGLPAVEALRLGTPAVISPDPALHEATQGHAVRMISWTATAVRDAVVAACDQRPSTVHLAGRTWREATEHLHELLHDMPAGAR